jgi:F-type H+-transporting ATPase subunit delta
LSSIKSFSNEVANRYALALFELAKENSELDIIEKNISDLLQLYNNSDELKNFIKNPTQSQSNQLKILNNLASKMSLSKVTNNFLSILITKRIIFFLKNIIQNFLLLVSKKKR